MGEIKSDNKKSLWQSVRWNTILGTPPLVDFINPFSQPVCHLPTLTATLLNAAKIIEDKQNSSIKK